MTKHDREEALAILEEGNELLGRYRAAEVGKTWMHNLDVIAAHSVMHMLWQWEHTNRSILMQELRPFLVAAFEMGREAQLAGT